MQQVEHYLRQAKAARELAAAAESVAVCSQFEGMAEGWERLARERLALLQITRDTLERGAPMNGAIQNLPGVSSGLDGR